MALEVGCVVMRDEGPCVQVVLVFVGKVMWPSSQAFDSRE